MSTSPEVNDINLNHLEATGDVDVNELAFIKDLVANEFYYRRELVDKLRHPNRDIDTDCGYPDTNQLSVESFLDLYQRFPIATRVIDLPVDESWRAQPDVYESEDEHDITDFEVKWDELHKKLRGEKSWFQDNDGSPIWEHLQRVDRLSRIGHYGVIFLELDDVGSKKKNGDVITWADPAPGFEDDVNELPQTELTRNGLKFPKSKVKLPTAKVEEEDLDQDSEDDDSEEGDDSEAVSGEAPKMGGKKKSIYDLPNKKEIDPESIETEVELIGLRCFDEKHAKVSVWEGNAESRRYGMPKLYTLQFGEVEGARSGKSVNSIVRDVDVHWSRIIHIADGLTNSEYIGTPACRPVTNDILDLQKIFGASGEGYWRMAFPGLSFESHPQLGAKVRFDAEGTKAQLERYQNTLQRYLATTGGSVKLLSGSVGDPTPHIEVRIESICIYLKCPVRIFKGSERGELASSQDKDSWDERMVMRQAGYITPRIIVPFVDRLIKIGVLPEPKGFSVSWPDITNLSKLAKVQAAAAFIAALGQYISGGVDSLIDPMFLLTKVFDFTQEEASEVLKAAEEFMAQKKEVQAEEAAEQAELQSQQMAGQAAQMADGSVPPMVPGQPPQPAVPGQQGPVQGQPPKGPVPPQLQKAKGKVPPPFLKKSPTSNEVVCNVASILADPEFQELFSIEERYEL